MSKGSIRRPASVPESVVDRRWKEAFNSISVVRVKAKKKRPKARNVFICATCRVRWPCLAAHQVAVQAAGARS